MGRVAASALACLLISTGCSAPPPTAPTAANLPISNSRMVGPFGTFAFDSQASYPVSPYTRQSSLRLYDDGGFALDYPSFSYTGTYTQRDGVLVFEWNAGSAGGAWGATGIINGDALTMRYNLVMELSDFENAIYRRMR